MRLSPAPASSQLARLPSWLLGAPSCHLLASRSSQEPPCPLGQAATSIQVQARALSRAVEVLSLCVGAPVPLFPTHALSPLCHLTCLSFLHDPRRRKRGAAATDVPSGGPQGMDLPLENPKIPIYSLAQEPMIVLPAPPATSLGPGAPRAPLSEPPYCQGGGSSKGKPSLSGSPSDPAGADYGQISEETWVYLNNLYGGGPEIAIRQSVAQLPDPESLHGEQKIEAETRAL